MNIIRLFIDKIVKFVGKIHWTPKNLLSDDELSLIKNLLKKDYYIILSRRNNHLSTYFIMLGNFLITGKFGYWGHALMNLENTIVDDSDFRLIEAISEGTVYTPFNKVFDVNGVVLLKPKSMSVDKWTILLDRARIDLGKPYDTLFDIKNDQQLSCVELVRDVLMAEPNYSIDFANFEAMIQSSRNLTPQMIYDCGDFEIVLEIKRESLVLAHD